MPLGRFRTWLALLPRQYDNMRRWKDGDFESDWKPGTNPIPEHFEDIPLEAQPTELDRTPLELSIGGPFYPGIEMTYIADSSTYSGKPFRINPN